MQGKDWTFSDVDNKRYTHALHLYPARMHPEIARRVIAKYARRPTDVVFDPFMGSGGGVLESILQGHDAVGIDVNPFAVLLSKVKTTPIKRGLQDVLTSILAKSSRDYKGGKQYQKCIPHGYDVKHWYSRTALNMLTIIKYHIDKIKSGKIADFFKICFALTIRKASYQRNSAWKTHKMPPADRISFKPKVLETFAKVCKDNIARMSELARADPKGKALPLLGNSKNIAPSFVRARAILNDSKANLVVTSPPYGDHKTTVAYGQFSRHPGHWLGLPEEQVVGVDKAGLGGHMYDDMDDLGSPVLEKTLRKVQRNDSKLTPAGKEPVRDREVHAFFYDLDICMEQISQHLALGTSHACFVVANRTVRRVSIPTDDILIELGKKHGFKLLSKIYRNIPNKAMPTRNAPENVAGQTSHTMTRETVIITRF